MQPWHPHGGPCHAMEHLKGHVTQTSALCNQVHIKAGPDAGWPFGGQEQHITNPIQSSPRCSLLQPYWSKNFPTQRSPPTSTRAQAWPPAGISGLTPMKAFLVVGLCAPLLVASVDEEQQALLALSKVTLNTAPQQCKAVLEAGINGYIDNQNGTKDCGIHNCVSGKIESVKCEQLLEPGKVGGFAKCKLRLEDGKTYTGVQRTFMKQVWCTAPYRI